MRIPVVASSATVAIRQRHSLPQTLIFFVTSRCNARCDFCLYKDSVENPTRRSEELTLDEIHQIAAAYGPLHFLALSGGEPFVRRDVGSICQTFIDQCGTSVVDIPSNFAYGDAMMESIEPLVANNPDVLVELQFSVDHLGARHDESRGVAGLYETAIENFGRLEELRGRHANLSLKVNIVWLERNRDDIEAIIAELRQRISFDRIHVSYPHTQIPTSGSDDESISDFDRFRVVAERTATAARKRFDPFSLPMRGAKVSSHRLLREALTGDAPMGAACEAGRHVVVLDERGEVFPCEVIWSSVGNVRTSGYSIGSVLKGPEYHAFRDEYLGATKCNCTWSCAAMTAVSVTPARYPRLLSDTLRVALGRDERP